METSTDPGTADAHSGDLAELRRQFAEFGAVQAKQSQSLDIITGKFNKLERASSEHRTRLFVLEAGLQGFREEMSGKFERLDNSVAVLKTDVAGLKDNVTVVEVKVDQLQADMADVKGSLKEILNRLPARAA